MISSKVVMAGLCVLVLGSACKLKTEKKEETGVNAGAFSIERTIFTRGEPVIVTFNQDMTTPPGQQHWITLTKPTDVESAWGVWHYVPQSAKTDKVIPPTPGEWEIRLHDLYPRFASRVIARQRITVN
jgi:hypothetical protein